MTKRNEQYWKNRVAQRMWEYMQSAEETADEAAKLYQKAAAYLNQEIDGIFEKYMTKHNLSEREAYDLLNQMTDRASIQELLQKLQNGAKDTEKEQLIQKLEAPAYRARIERLEQIQSQLDQIMRNVYQLFPPRIMRRWLRRPITNQYSTFSNAPDMDFPLLRLIRK